MLRKPGIITRTRYTFALISAIALSGCSGAPNPLSPAAVAPASSGATAQGGPSSYDATGRWFGQVFIEGESRVGSGVHIFTQAPSGSMTAVGSEPPGDPERDHGIYTFKRIGSPNGVVRRYRFSLRMEAQPGAPCGRELDGDAELDTSTNTLTATSTGTIDNCAAVTVRFKWVKQ